MCLKIMKKPRMNLKDLCIDREWSVFLDRDGVINKRLPGDYVKKWEEFEFLPGVVEALSVLSGIFGYVFVVTNQQGIGKGLMSEKDLERVHEKMISEIEAGGGRIDGIYHSPYLESENHPSRKPQPGMAMQAIMDFPRVILEKSLMVGDTVTDIQFGHNTGMYTVLITPQPTPSQTQTQTHTQTQTQTPLPDLTFSSLIGFARELKKITELNKPD